MAKYKVGDKVRVKYDLEVGHYYSMETADSAPRPTGTVSGFASEMSKFRGRVCEISSIGNYGYSIEEDEHRFIWTDEMLEPVSESDSTKKTYIISADISMLVGASSKEESYIKASRGEGKTVGFKIWNSEPMVEK